MEDAFQFIDEIGPAKIVHVYEPSVSLKGILVIDNIATGPAIGGLRMATDVTTEECFRLARAMTLKNAAAGIPHGGGKSAIIVGPKLPKHDKEKLMRSFACALRKVEEYIFAPDMGTDEECMAWVHDEIGRAVGLPREIGGIPLDEIGATAWGLSHVTDIALSYCDFKLDGARVVIQGFGAVGKNTARFLAERGANLIGVADSKGAIVNTKGVDVKALIKLKEAGKSVIDYSDAKKIERDEVIDIACDIWIPAARPDIINESNMHRLKTKLIVEGANIPITCAAEKYLYEQGVLYIPDFIANAGGVICASAEHQGSGKAAAFAAIEEKLIHNTQEILETSKRENILPRDAAIQLAEQRINKAMSFRRWSLFSSAPGFI